MLMQDRSLVSGVLKPAGRSICSGGQIIELHFVGRRDENDERKKAEPGMTLPFGIT
jgi:hypothetical protein